LTADLRQALDQQPPIISRQRLYRLQAMDAYSHLDRILSTDWQVPYIPAELVGSFELTQVVLSHTE